MRAKRIAAMQRAMAQSASHDDALSHASSSTSQQSAQSRPESALNRLAATATTSAASAGSSVFKSPVPQVKPVSVAKTTTTPAASARASPVPVVRPQPAMKKVSYDEWECDKIGEILGVSLSVRESPTRTESSID